MGGTKKPRKAYRPKQHVGTPINLRWAVDKDKQTYFDAAPWQALSGLTAPDANEGHVATLESAVLLLRELLGCMGETTEQAEAVVAAGCLAVAQIKERHERTQRVGATGTEIQALKDAIVYLEAALTQGTRRQHRDALVQLMGRRVVIQVPQGAAHAGTV